MEPSYYWFWRKRWWIIQVWPEDERGLFIGWTSWARRDLMEAIRSLRLLRQANAAECEFGLVYARRKPYRMKVSR